MVFSASFSGFKLHLTTYTRHNTASQTHRFIQCLCRRRLVPRLLPVCNLGGSIAWEWRNRKRANNNHENKAKSDIFQPTVHSTLGVYDSIPPALARYIRGVFFAALPSRLRSGAGNLGTRLPRYLPCQHVHQKLHSLYICDVFTDVYGVVYDTVCPNTSIVILSLEGSVF